MNRWGYQGIGDSLNQHNMGLYGTSFDRKARIVSYLAKWRKSMLHISILKDILNIEYSPRRETNVCPGFWMNEVSFKVR